jgi:hypothetical protein
VDSGFPRQVVEGIALAEELARPAGLTAAWWQVLGAVLREPLPCPGSRAVGITRQSGEAELAQAVEALERLSKILDASGPAVTEP